MYAQIPVSSLFPSPFASFSSLSFPACPSHSPSRSLSPCFMSPCARTVTLPSPKPLKLIRFRVISKQDPQHDYAPSPAESSAFVPLTKPLHFNLFTLINEDRGQRTISFGDVGARGERGDQGERAEMEKVHVRGPHNNRCAYKQLL